MCYNPLHPRPPPLLARFLLTAAVFHANVLSHAKQPSKLASSPVNNPESAILFPVPPRKVFVFGFLFFSPLLPVKFCTIYFQCYNVAHSHKPPHMHLTTVTSNLSVQFSTSTKISVNCDINTNTQGKRALGKDVQNMSVESLCSSLFFL